MHLPWNDVPTIDGTRDEGAQVLSEFDLSPHSRILSEPVEDRQPGVRRVRRRLNPPDESTNTNSVEAAPPASGPVPASPPIADVKDESYTRPPFLSPVFRAPNILRAVPSNDGPVRRGNVSLVRMEELPPPIPRALVIDSASQQEDVFNRIAIRRGSREEPVAVEFSRSPVSYLSLGLTLLKKHFSREAMGGDKFIREYEEITTLNGRKVHIMI